MVVDTFTAFQAALLAALEEVADTSSTVEGAVRIVTEEGSCQVLAKAKHIVATELAKPLAFVELLQLQLNHLLGKPLAELVQLPSNLSILMHSDKLKLEADSRRW